MKNLMADSTQGDSLPDQPTEPYYTGFGFSTTSDQPLVVATTAFRQGQALHDRLDGVDGFELTSEDLDGLALDKLYETIEKVVSRRITRLPDVHIFFRKLDGVYLAKSMRLMGEPQYQRIDFELFACHVSDIVETRAFKSIEDNGVSLFFNRWRTLADLAMMKTRQLESERDARKVFLPKGGAAASWNWVLTQVYFAGESGLKWSDLYVSAERMADHADPPISNPSKAKVSVLVANMRSAGWLRVVPEGRGRILFVGSRAPSRRSIFDESDARLAPPSSVYERSKVLGTVVKEGTCSLQGAFVDFYFCAAERHRTLKQKVQSPHRKNSTTRLDDELKNIVVDFHSFLHNRTEQAAKGTFGFIQRYFSERRATFTGIAPRISIKVIGQAGDHRQVVDLVRDHPALGLSHVSNIDENTGFVQVCRTGQFFLMNDIPQAALDGRYKNPRLLSDYVDALANSRSIRSSRDLSLKQWSTCWLGSGNDLNNSYRSTLIVPLTLLNNQLSQEFRKGVNDRAKDFFVGNSTSPDRTIMGFLCLDHPDTHYFQEEDIEIGYVFADWLAMFLFVRYMFTSLSSTLRDATQRAFHNKDDLKRRFLQNVINSPEREDGGALRRLLSSPSPLLRSAENQFVLHDEMPSWIASGSSR
jgi:hypothetical protein